MFLLKAVLERAWRICSL